MNFTSSLLSGIQSGQQNFDRQEKRSKLAQLQSLTPTALSGDPGALSQLASLDIDHAKKVQDHRDGGLRRFEGMISFIDNARATNDPRQLAGAMRQVAPYIKQLTGKDINPDEPWTDEWTAGWDALKAQVAAAKAGQAAPAGLAQFQGMATAAGLQPGSAEYQRAARVNLGLDGRASGAGYTLVKFTGPDGRERIGTMSGATGQISMPDGSTFDPQANGIQVQRMEGGGQMAAQPAGGTVFTTSEGEQFDVSQVSDPHLRQQIMQNPQAWGMAPDGSSAALPASSAQVQPAGGNQFVGRAPEEQAAATERAKLQAQAEYLPQELAMRGQAAVNQAVGIEQGKQQLEQVNAAPGAIATMQQSITAIDELLNSPDLGSIVGMGSMNPLNRIPGSAARGLIARAEQIGGQAFLAAFNQLKGGGAITDREGAAATAAMARLDRSQSLADYQTALRDLRAAIAPALERQRATLARGQAGAGSGPAQSAQPARPNQRPVMVSSPADYNALPAGALYTAPDGSTRRKK